MRDLTFNFQKIHGLKVSPEIKRKVLESGILELQKMLTSKIVTSEQITLIFYERIVKIGKSLNLVTEIMFERALRHAQQCDKLREENPEKCKGYLFGIPFSLQDHFLVKGYDSTCGNPNRCFQPAQEDCFLIKLLEEQGAFPLVKSNIPSDSTVKECHNIFWGRAKNPINDAFSLQVAEAGLIAAGCSSFGIAIDYFGSLRISALSCGVVGFKPTTGRIIDSGYVKEYYKPFTKEYLHKSPGILARDASDLNLIMKSLINNSLYDQEKVLLECPTYMRKEWNEAKILQQKLTIGYIKEFKSHPISHWNLKAIERAIELLRKENYQVIEIDTSKITEILNIAEEIISRREIECQHSSEYNTNMSIHCKKSLSNSKACFSSADELKNKILKAEGSFFEIWKEKNLDAIILPGSVVPGFKHGYTETGNDFYTVVFEIFNCSFGVVPVSKVQEADENSKNLNLPQSLRENMDGMTGLPLGVQVVTPPWEDEKCVNVMMRIQKLALS